MKQSNYIEYPQAMKFIDRACHSIRQDTPWNFFITINPEMAGIDPTNVSNFIRDGLRRLKNYYDRNNMPFCCGWVMEHKKSVGVHVHILTHRPDKIPMNPMKLWWAILKRFQLKKIKGILQTRRFYTHQPYNISFSRLISYLLKGIRPEAFGHLVKNSVIHINQKKRPIYQGKVVGKRIGWIA